MKIAKKILSVFLSVLMVFGTCSIALTNFSLTANAAAADVQALINAAHSKATGVSVNGDTWVFTGDDGKVIAAAEAIIDYALSVRDASAKSTTNSTNGLAAKVVSDCGFSTSSSQAAFIHKVLNPTGTSVYSYGQSTKTGSFNYSMSGHGYSNGDNIYNTELRSSASFPSVKDTATTPVTKTTSITVDLNSYLKTFTTVESVPSSFLTSLAFSATHDGYSEDLIGNSFKNNTDNCGSYTNTTVNYTAYAWNTMSDAPTKTSTSNTTAKTDLTKFANVFSDDVLDTTVEEIMAMDSDTVAKLYSDADAAYKSFIAAYGRDVMDHFFDADAIEEYLALIEMAGQLAVAAPNMEILINSIAAGYDKTDLEEMQSIYAVANTAYETIKDFKTEVFDSLKAQDSKYDAFSLEASKTFVETLYYDIEVAQLKALKAAIDADIADWSDKVYGSDDATSEDKITNDELLVLNDKFIGYKTTLATYSAKAIAAVFTDGTSYISEFHSAVTEQIEIYEGYTPFFQYFMPLLFGNFAEWTNDDFFVDKVVTDDAGNEISSETLGRYDYDTEELAKLIAEYNAKLGTHTDEYVNTIYTIYYNDADTLLQEAVRDSLARLLTYIEESVAASLDVLAPYMSAETEVNFYNVAELRKGLKGFNEDLYNWANGRGLVDSTHQNIYANYANVKAKYDAFLADGGLSDKYFSQIRYDKNGYYDIRYAGYQADADISYPSDIARDGAEDNFVTTADKLLATVGKLDTFISSDEFSELIGLAGETAEDTTGEEAVDITAMIQELLNGSVFTNDLINTIVGALFPMIQTLLEEEVPKLLQEEMAEDGAVVTPGSSAKLDLSVAGVSGLSGELDVYLGDDEFWGKRHQKDFPTVLNDLGLYAFPGTMADSLVRSGVLTTDSEIYKTFKATATSWQTLGVWNEEEEAYEYEFEFDWGVTDYESFVRVLGGLLDTVAPLLPTLFLNYDFDKTANEAAFAYGDLKYSIFSANNSQILANLGIFLGNMDLYDKLWIPLCEALGMTDGGYQMRTLTTSSTGTDYARALLEPVYNFINTLTEKPLDTILGILPTLSYVLCMDWIGTFMDSNSINYTLTLKIEDIDGGILANILDLLAGLIEIDVLDDSLPLSEVLNLEELLGFNYTDINELLAYVLTSTGMELTLPEIDQVGLIFLAEASTNAPSQRRSGVRNQLKADKADVLWYLLQTVLEAVSTDGFLDQILAATAEEGEEPTELPSLVYKILENLKNNPNDALSALTELLNPVTYDLMEIDWVDSGYDYTLSGMRNDASIIYLDYHNDWTKSDSKYVINNIDAIIESVLEMTGSEETSINALLKNTINGLFTNETLTSVIEVVASLGSVAEEELIVDILKDSLGADLTLLADAFSYLFVTEEDTEEDFVAPLKPGDEGYTNNTKLTAAASEVTDEETGETETVITWYYDGEEFTDGDRDMFVDILVEAIQGVTPVLMKILKGEDLEVLGIIEVLGYESYKYSIGLLFEILGVENVLSQKAFNALSDNEAVTYIIDSLFGKIDVLLEGNTVKNIVELLPNLIYFIESNGIAVVLHNLLMPILVLLDTIRPIFNIDLNATLSLIVSDLVNYGEIDTDMLLEFLSGVYYNDDLDYKWITVDVNELRVSDIFAILDDIFGTKLELSQLSTIGLDALAASVTGYDSVIGTAYKSTMDTADAFTILISALLETAEFEVADGVTNGDMICKFIDDSAEEGEESNAAEIYSAVMDLIKGYEISYSVPDWGYMFPATTTLGDNDKKVTLPAHSIVYLDYYTTDWTEDTAIAVEGVLNEIVELVLEETADGNTIAQLLSGILNDSVYTDANLTAIVEAIVNLIGSLDATLLDLIDVVIDADISAWFAMCELVDEIDENGNVVVDDEGNAVQKFVVKAEHNWGVDEAAEEYKKDIFVAGLKEVLAPANSLLSFLFFGDDFNFFTSSETGEDGEYTYDAIINIVGGEGYAYGLVPILEALGCEMKPAAAYYDAATNTYNVGNAVADIIDSVLTLVDEFSGDPATGLFELLANVLYFINADGVKSSVNNLLAPIDALIAKLAPVISEDGEAQTLASMLEETIGFDLSDLSMESILTIINNETGFILSTDMYQIITNLYIGELTQFTSANGNYAYEMTYTSEEDHHDMLTIVLAFALDAFNLNSELFSDLLGEEEYKAVYNLIRGAADKFDYAEIDWAYMYEDIEGGMTALEQLESTSDNGNKYFPEYAAGSAAFIYTQYANNWNKETAEYVDDIIDALVDGFFEEGSSLGILLDKAITKGLYQDDILNSLLESVVGLLVDYAGIVEGAGALLGAESITKWFDYCEITYDENGDAVVTVTHDFGIDEAATNDEKRVMFVEAFVDVLEPAYRLLSWLLFEEDYTFFHGTTNEALITLTGSRGYEEGLVPLLEALGCVMPENYDAPIVMPGDPDYCYANGETGIKPASAYMLADGGINMEQAVRDVFTALTDWLHILCGDLQNQKEYGTIGTMLELLPNVIYNLNAGTLKAVVSNLLLPVEEILGHLEAFGLEVDFSTLIEIDGKALDIKNLDWYAVFDIVEGLVPLYWPENIQDFLATLYVGKAVEFTSANNKTAYFMTYNDEDGLAEDSGYLVSSRADMTTLVISFVIDGYLDERNEDRLAGWIGEDIYELIYAYLTDTAKTVEMQTFDWILTEYANTGVALSPITMGSIYSYVYGELYTREMGEYIEKWLPSFIDTMIVLLGVEAENGTMYDGLDDILNTLIGDTVYTKANLDSILEMIQGLIPTLKEELGEELFDVIANVLNSALEIDLTYWDTYTVADFTDGDREAFVAELIRMLEPLYPILEWLLTDEDLVALFYTADGNDALVIEGAEGYAYGIIPLLEAFDYDSDLILTPDEYKEAANGDPKKLLENILDPILDVVDTVLADPVNEIFNVLPGIIYFLNSNGLDTVIKNTANAVFAVLENIEPITGELDIYELIGFDPTQINIDTLIEELLISVEEDTGFRLKDTAMEAITELTVGEVISFTSKNGETAYTMQYATGADRVDMVTIILRAVLTFVSVPENVVALEAMLEGELSEDGYNFLCSLLENFSQMAASEDGMDEIMYTVYQIFYAANVAAHKTENWIAEFNGDYSFLNQLFATSDVELLKAIGRSFGMILDDNFGDIIDSDELAPNGFIKFFQMIAEFFRKIADFFKGLFA